MSTVTYYVRNDDPDELANLQYYIDRIKTNARTILCQKMIGEQFAEDSLDNCDLLFVHEYDGDIRGFATVKYYIDPRDATKEYFYIDLICNAPWHSMATRSVSDMNEAYGDQANQVRMGAKDIIDKIVEVGKTNAYRISFVQLKAIDSVISYYWRLGFRFPNVEMNDKAQQFVRELRAAQVSDNANETERLMNAIIVRYFPKHLSESKQAELATTTGSRVEYAQDTGIPMELNIVYRGGKNRSKKNKRTKRKYKKRTYKKK
jgi:hypothetical protein